MPWAPLLLIIGAAYAGAADGDKKLATEKQEQERARIEQEETAIAGAALADPESTIAWAEANLMAKERAAALGTIVTSLPPATVLALLEAKKLDAAEIAPEFVESWGRKDPKAASLWLEALPQSEKRCFAVTCLAEVWAQRDADEAITWITALRDPRERDEAARTVLHSGRVLRDKPAESLRLAVVIEDAEMRESCLLRVFRKWYTADREPALAWYNANKELLSTEATAHLLEMFARIDEAIKGPNLK